MIERDELCSLIPHAHAMCLLDRVEDWGDKFVCCTSHSHRLSNNPLLRDGRLAAVHAIEYAAQAMAVHGALLARGQGKQAQQGYIAALRDIVLHTDFLQDKEAPLDIRADALLQNQGAMIYQFKVASGEVGIAEGRITVMKREGVPSYR